MSKKWPLSVVDTYELLIDSAQRQLDQPSLSFDELTAKLRNREILKAQLAVAQAREIDAASRAQ